MMIMVFSYYAVNSRSCPTPTPAPFPVAMVCALQVKTVYTDVLSPFPKEIAQLDEQSVVFESTLLAVSPYKTAKQNTVITLASPKVRVCTPMVAFVSLCFPIACASMSAALPPCSVAIVEVGNPKTCLLYTSPSPRD